MIRRLIVLPLVVAATVAAGCGAGTPSRSDVLSGLAKDVIVPAYELLAAETAELFAATSTLCDSGAAADLAAARRALADARDVWSYSEAFWVGPVMERRSWAVIDWPISQDEIEALIADDTSELSADRLGRRIGADQRGLGAVEYILGHPGNDESVLDALGDRRRCEYLTGVSALIASESALILADWTVDFEGEGPYRGVFSVADGDGLDAIVNDSLFLLEAMTDLELGAALGEMDLGEPNLDSLVEGPAALAVADLLAHLDGLQAVLTGNQAAPGLGPLLGNDLSDRLRQQLEVARAKVALIDPPLRVATVERPSLVRAARDALKAVQVTVATEVVSRLGVQIGFSDADGDTGS